MSQSHMGCNLNPLIANSRAVNTSVPLPSHEIRPYRRLFAEVTSPGSGVNP